MTKLVNLNTDYLLATILADRQSVSFLSLTDLQREIEKQCPGAVVDVSSPGIQNALAYYPAIFKREEKEITKAQTANDYLGSEYFEQEFTRSVPCEVHAMVKQAITKVLPAEQV